MRERDGVEREKRRRQEERKREREREGRELPERGVLTTENRETWSAQIHISWG